MDSSGELALHETQNFLAERYSQIQVERDGKPVFAIEHGLNPAQTIDLLKVTGRCYARFGIDSDIVRKNPLPLIAASTEIGYRYRGTGTDFWPELETALNAEILIADREKFTEFFVTASKMYGFARPNDSEWSRAYRHIAWPVRNALAPLEIHLPLAATLRTVLRSSSTSVEGSERLQNLRAIAVGLWSRRLEDWLSDEETALDVTSFLLSGEETQLWLTSEIIQRISVDLRANPTANRAIKDAADAAQKRGGRRLPAPPRSRLAISVLNGTPQQLLLMGPELNEQARNDILTLFEANRNFLCSTGGKVVQLDTFLSGGILDLGCPATLQNAAAILGMISDPKLTVDATQRVLDALQPEPAVLFAMGYPQGLAINIEENSILDPSRSYYELLRCEGPDAEIEASTGWPGHQVRQVNIEEPRWSEELTRLGCTISRPRIIHLSGGISLNHSDDQITSLSGLPLLIQTVDAPAELSVSDEHSNLIYQASLVSGKLAVLDLEEGRYSVNVEQNTSARDFFVQIKKPMTSPAFSIDLSLPRPEVRHFLGAELGVYVTGPLPFDGMSLTGVVSYGAEVLATETVQLSDLPARISGASIFFANLRRAVLDSKWNDSSPIRLSISIDGLGSREWLLANSPPHFVFEETSRTWRVEGSDEQIQSRICSSLAPLISDDLSTNAKSGFHLLLPASPERSAIMSGKCFGAPTLVPGDTDIKMPTPLLREPDSLDGSIGVLAVSEAYIAWRLSSVPNVLGDYMRQKVVSALELALVQQLCGEEWRSTETNCLFSTPMQSFLYVCKQHKLTKHGELPEVAPEYDSHLDVFLDVEFSEVFPGFEAALAMDDETLAERLDFAVMNAYEALNAKLASDGVPPLEEADIAYSAQRWRNAVQDASNRWDLSIFKNFILPKTRWDSLRHINYSQTFEDELTEVVFASHVDPDLRSGFTWLSRRELRTGLQLWLSPRQLLESEDWSSDLMKLLSDQQSARALRYAALRLRAALNAEDQFLVPS